MRSVSEWIGKTDDAAIPVPTKRRIIERQGGCCAISGIMFDAKNIPEFDHKIALWAWTGEGTGHRETNLQAILGGPHKEKTKREASIRKKVYRMKDKHLGLREKKPWNTKLRKKMNGEVVRIDEE